MSSHVIYSFIGTPCFQNSKKICSFLEKYDIDATITKGGYEVVAVGDVRNLLNLAYFKYVNVCGIKLPVDYKKI